MPLPTASEIYATCLCLALQRATRATARRYDLALKPLGITSGQYSILSALLQDRPVPIGRLAEVLGMDRTTLTRNLKPLEANGLLETLPTAADRRVRHLALAPQGRALLLQAIPLWQKAQATHAARLAPAGWAGLKPVLEALT